MVCGLSESILPAAKQKGFFYKTVDVRYNIIDHHYLFCLVFSWPKPGKGKKNPEISSCYCRLVLYGYSVLQVCCGTPMGLFVFIPEVGSPFQKLNIVDGKDARKQISACNVIGRDKQTFYPEVLSSAIRINDFYFSKDFES